MLACAVVLQPAPVPAVAQSGLSNQMTVGVVQPTYIATATVNSAVPNVDSAGRNVAQTSGWTDVDIFVTADVSGTATLTATAQVSADGVNWTTADLEYWNGSAIATRTHQRVMTADGTEYMTVKLAGEYWRVSLQTTGGVTTTVNATMRR